MPEHIPVLLNEVVDLMSIRPGGTYVDATYGRGGHSRALLDGLDARGRLFVIDRDPKAFEHARTLAASDSRVTAVRQPFSKIEEILIEHRGKVDGVLFDLGMSTPQLDDPERGFSFQHDGPLDMRMDPAISISARDWLMSAREREISDVLWEYGEERRSRQIARKIVDTRQQRPLKSTHDLAQLVRSCMRGGRGRIDPATRTFQAVRIFINDELGEIERALQAVLDLLGIGGRLLVIAFHSLEDRLVKRQFRSLAQLSRLEDNNSSGPCYRLLTPKPVMAGDEEKTRNPRARSARLRALERHR